MSSRYAPQASGGGGGGSIYQRDPNRNALFPPTASPYGGHASASARSPSPGFRSATPNSRGQYSASVMEELESQNEEHLEGLGQKVRMLRDITEAIGDEVRSSSTLISNMNDSFDSTRARLRGTMGGMMRMAQRTGVGWKAWLGFIGAVILLFWYVWL